MKKKKAWLILCAAIILLVIIFFLFLFKRTGTASNILVLYGNIDIRQADLGFRVFGRLKKMYVEEGDVVSKGQLIGEMDDAPYIQNLQEARAKANSIQQSLLYASAQLNRRSSLISGNSISEEEYEQSFFNHKTLEANYQEALAEINIAQIELDDTKLHSPSNGVVYTRIREPGTILNLGDPVYSIAVDMPIWARTYISEPELGLIYPGMKAEIYTDTPQNPVYKGHIGFISPIAEFTPKNVETTDLRTNLVYQVRVIIDSPSQGLRQGMPVTVHLKLEREKPQ